MRSSWRKLLLLKIKRDKRKDSLSYQKIFFIKSTCFEDLLVNFFEDQGKETCPTIENLEKKNGFAKFLSKPKNKL